MPFVIALILCSFCLWGQVSYSGFIDKYPIEMVTDVYSDGDAHAIYTYTRFDDPIIVNGRFKNNVMTLFEKDVKGDTMATLTFNNFRDKSETLNGTWKNLKTGKELSIALKKDFDLDDGDSVVYANREIIQPVALKQQYFKLLVSKEQGSFYPRVTGVKILEKKTHKLVQEINLDCQLMGLDNISAGDFNFDGNPDFSVFEASYAGPNTTSLYFLYDPKTSKFFNSGFEGTSLDFDAKAKRIFEHNQCCAGSIHTTSVYKVENNKMVLIEEHCYKWNEKKQDLEEREMKDCQ